MNLCVDSIHAKISGVSYAYFFIGSYPVYKS